MKPFRTFRDRVKPEKFLFAQAMRKKPTESEKILWNEIKSRKLGVKFRRQSPILGWIVDFYCPSHNLVIELDGLYHKKPEVLKADAKRDSVMASYGFYTMRIDNKEVLENTTAVLDKIRHLIAGIK